MGGDGTADVAGLQETLVKTQKQLESLQKEMSTPRDRREASGVQADVDKEKMQKLYGKYLRAESFRKALVYQKQYLLLLLGGFQDCEEETLAVIARFGVTPKLEGVRVQDSPLARFRVAVRAVIAVHRLQFLVRKWRRAVRAVPSSAANSRAGSRASTPSYHLNGNLRLTPSSSSPSHARTFAASPGLSQREILQSRGVGSQQHQGDSSDFINRLEHLQTRLKSKKPASGFTSRSAAFGRR